MVATSPWFSFIGISMNLKAIAFVSFIWFHLPCHPEAAFMPAIRDPPPDGNEHVIGTHPHWGLRKLFAFGQAAERSQGC